jgi:hypothetical protein
VVNRLRPENDHNPGEPSQRDRDLSRYSESFTRLHLARLSRNTAHNQSDKCTEATPLLRPGRAQLCGDLIVLRLR